MTRFLSSASSSLISRASSSLVITALALALGGCPAPPSMQLSSVPPTPPVEPTLPPAFPPGDIVGRWGLAAYHNDEDRGRMELAAANQCRQPYVITLGPTGGVMMHLADQAMPTELRLKGSRSGKTFVGPADEPPGSMQDREFLDFNGNVMVLRWMNSEVQDRYGTAVYTRCAPEGAKGTAKPRAKSAAKPESNANAKPKPAT